MAKQPFLTRLKQMLGGQAPQTATTLQNDTTSPREERPNFNFSDERIPTASTARVARIQALLIQIEEQARLTTSGRDALEEARRIETAYLPELMESYFDIPPNHRAEIFRRTGRSASFQLNERLDTMITELNRISASFAAGKIDSFSVNLKFIDQRFQGANDPFA